MGEAEMARELPRQRALAAGRRAIDGDDDGLGHSGDPDIRAETAHQRL